MRRATEMTEESRDKLDTHLKALDGQLEHTLSMNPNGLPLDAIL